MFVEAKKVCENKSDGSKQRYSRSEMEASDMAREIYRGVGFCCSQRQRISIKVMLILTNNNSIVANIHDNRNNFTNAHGHRSSISENTQRSLSNIAVTNKLE
ncbi:hypothetical protein MKW94_027931 [Papaver nudicaule]|uniref:Uncharacterized protein n=1 Tax=Papaver nudicaule TaxID=74823 RepID=A0AA42B409_PAPNU|nr:hypothetical protein [Papaver nudicaule]